MLKLFFNQPAASWEEILPVGNGRIGGMIWGGTQKEKIGLNEDSLWSGYYQDKNNPAAANHLNEVRELIFAGQYEQAELQIQKHMLGGFNESYLPLGNLLLSFDHKEPLTAYRRELDLDTAVAAVMYQCGKAEYKRELFASQPAQCLIIKLSCSQPELNVALSFESQLACQSKITENMIKITGQCPESVAPSYLGDFPGAIIQGSRGQLFSADIKILSTDGVVSSGDQLQVHNASFVTLSFSAVKPDKVSEDHSYSDILQAHIDDYKSLFDSTQLYMGEQPDIPVDERLRRLREGYEDPALYALYFQYGRYLLIASSREGTMPANLQGIWNWHYRAPWSSNYTTNINAEMNYWPAQSCNLAQCLEPFFSYLEKLVEEGKKTARVHYNCRGFVVHHNTDLWMNANPVGKMPDAGQGLPHHVTWAMWPMGGAWLSSELYKHFEYHNDLAFLKKRAYPILRENVLFLIDWLVEKDGQYVTCPSTSPENRFETSDGQNSCTAIATAMDLALIRESFDHFRKTCHLLKIEDPVLDEISEREAKLAPFKTGSRGQLLEWHEEFSEPEPGHRHISHLYGLFPSELFTKQPDLIRACEKALLLRLEHGSGHTGWSCAWIANMMAILGRPDDAYRFVNQLLTKSTYPNLWDAHPPFQIDGNFGGTAAIANMLVQCRLDEIKVLPAWPAAWANGYVKGLRVKNNQLIDIEWENGKLKSHRIYEHKQAWQDGGIK